MYLAAQLQRTPCPIRLSATETRLLSPSPAAGTLGQKTAAAAATPPAIAVGDGATAGALHLNRVAGRQRQTAGDHHLLLAPPRGLPGHLPAFSLLQQLPAAGVPQLLAAGGHEVNLTAAAHLLQLTAGGHEVKLAAADQLQEGTAGGHEVKLTAAAHLQQLTAGGHEVKLAAASPRLTSPLWTDRLLKCNLIWDLILVL
jgi:hypothetical protein